MPRKNLTDRTVAALRPPATGQVDWYDAKNPRFGIRLSYNGTRTWFLFDKDPHTGKRRRVALGRYPTVSLKDARTLALDHGHALTVEKRDPVAARKAQREALTFKGLADRYVTEHAKAHKRSWKEDERILGKYFAGWHGRPAEGITRPEVVATLQGIKRDHGPIMANRALAVVRKMYNYAIRNGVGNIADNPARMVDRPARETSRDRIYSDDELKALWKAFREIGIAGDVLKLCAVTGQRLGEVRGLRRDEIAEIEGAGLCWTLPGSRSKNGRANVVPLSDLAVRIIEDAPRLSDEFVFASPKPSKEDKPVTIGSKLSHRVRKQSGVADFTPHDLRRTFRTAVAPLGFDRQLGERVLGHVMVGVEAVYDRHTYLGEKRDLLEAWGRYVERVTGLSDNVVQMKPKASA